MAQIRLPENIAKLAQVTGGTLKLPASVVNIGARQYQTTADTTLNVGVIGANGLDASLGGTSTALYYVYAVIAAGALSLVGSLNPSLPAGYSAARLVGHFVANGAGAIAQVFYASQYDMLSNAPMKNLLINGNFDFWQRATTLGTASGSRYCADRWVVFTTGTTSSTDRIAFTTGQTAVPNEPTYNHQIAVNSVANAGNLGVMITSIEDVRTLAGQNATFTFWAKSSVARNIAIEFEQSFGSGGSPSAGVTSIGVTTVALTTNYAKYTVTVAIPSIAGKTLGTILGSSYLRINIWLDAGATFNARTNSLGQQGSAVYNFASMSLVQGSVAPSQFYLASGDLVGELTACQRYYEKSYEPDTPPATATTVNQIQSIASSSGELDQSWFYKVTKRAAPSVSLYSPSGNQNRAAAGADVVINVGQTSSHSFYINSSGVTGASSNYQFHFAADADF